MTKELVPCKYRVPLPSPCGANVIGIGDITRTPLYVASNNLTARFECGMCQLLTAYDMGPVQCLQPQHSEATCPDIKDLEVNNI